MDPRFQQLYDLFSHLYELERVLNDLVVTFRQRIQQEVEIDIRARLVRLQLRKTALRPALLMDQIYGRSRIDGIRRCAWHYRDRFQTGRRRPVPQADDAIQLEARQPCAGESATTLKNMEIELKGLVVV
jgi:hypothetical protein